MGSEPEGVVRSLLRGDQRVGVIGLGYVGLPLAVSFARAGLDVLGIDVDAGKIASLNEGVSYILDVSSEDLAALTKTKQLRASTDYAGLAEVDAMFICVPTPFDAMRAPDLSYIIAAAESIAPHLKHSQMVVLQSTTFPGTTQEIVQPIHERGGLIAGRDYDLAFSPERIDPGRSDWTVTNTPKVVGGIDAGATNRASELLQRIGAPVVRVSSPRAAEMTKLLENIFRSVNIALVNEMALLCERMDIDIWEVIGAAKTKPYGFMPFTPSAGVGGHCIGVDPYYLSWKAREFDFYTKFIELAAEVNQSMPFHVIELVSRALSEQHISVKDANVLVLGVAFKRDVDDARNSPAERVMELLLRQGARVQYHDPFVTRFRIGGDVFQREPREFLSQPLSEALLAKMDCVVIITGHRTLDYNQIVASSRTVVDTCNATEFVRKNREKITRLGAG